MIDQQIQLNMVIGYPLTHSLSPALHNKVYPLLNLHAIMLPHASQDLASSLSALKTLAVGYIAVTMPFKQQILQYLDVCSREVELMQTANTVIFKSGKLYGYNTDVAGIDYALRHTAIKNKKVLLIGSGGAAYAAAYYLKEKQAHLFCFNRSQAHAQQLIHLFGGKIVQNTELNELAFDVIINATPLGMNPHTNETPLKDYHFHTKQTVFDMVYNPINTVLLTAAKAQGATCISGLDMFLAQGLKQIALWSNQQLDMEKLISFIKQDPIFAR